MISTESAASASGKQKRRYFVASQDKDLRQGMSSIPGIPIIYLNKVTLVLEPPSTASQNYRNTVRQNPDVFTPVRISVSLNIH